MQYPYGKTILVTGGSSGIGAACVRLFAQNGYTVYACARTPDRKAEDFPGGGRVRPLVMDVCDEDSVERGVRAALDEAGDIGAVIHCAGMGIAGRRRGHPGRSRPPAA
jgi:NAD(P)-dependent dehydrogenase (short-subunit alcohol dehydrogenase family)